MEAIRLGAYDYITKPFSLEEIGVQVRNMVEHVSLTKENARLSVRLQELLEQINRMQSDRLDVSRFQEEIRRELQETNRKLDQLLSTNTPPATSYAASAYGAETARARSSLAPLPKLPRALPGSDYPRAVPTTREVRAPAIRPQSVYSRILGCHALNRSVIVRQTFDPPSVNKLTSIGPRRADLDPDLPLWSPPKC
jgi:hypothetical protein